LSWWICQNITNVIQQVLFMKLIFTLLPGLVFVVYLWGVGTARADGILFSERSLKPMEIPGQTAVILHDEGRETLTIWNTVQSDASAMAWVLPLPAVPDVIQQTDQSAIRLLKLVAAPRMTIWDKPGWAGWVLAGIVLLIAGAFLRARRPEDSTGSGCWIMAGIFFLLTLWAASFAHYGTSPPNELAVNVDGISIKSVQDTGDYETKVISGNSAGQINAWLTGNGFSGFTGDQIKVVEDYIGRKWVFLCAKLKATAPGLAGVRPLTVRFASQEAIYPMSLTREAGTVPVDLYTLGSDEMEDPTGRLKQIGISLRRSALVHGVGRGAMAWTFRDAMQKLQDGQANPGVPFIPAGKDVLLDGFLEQAEGSVSHLAGVFGPASDWSDVILAPARSAAPRIRYRTRAAWISEVLANGVGGMATAAFLIIAFFARSAGPAGKRPGWWWSVAASMLGLGVLAVGLYFSASGVVFISSSQLYQAPPGSPESFQELLDQWVRALSTAP